MEHTHHHPHQSSELSGQTIRWVTVLNASITIAEVIGGLLSGSLALLSDAMHNLSDTLSIGLSYTSHRIAQRPKNKRKTFGYRRAEILSAFINALSLIVISGFLILEAIRRWLNPEPIKTGLMLTVAMIGLVANLLSVLLLKNERHHNLNLKSTYLHLLSDALSSLGVIVGGILIRFFQVVWVDPLLTVGIAAYILKEGIELLKVTIDILMQASPHLDYEHLKEEIETIPYVKNIHHIHAWSLDEKHIYFEAHIDFEDHPLSTIQPSLHEIEHRLKDRYGIHHVTLQAECDVCKTKDLF